MRKAIFAVTVISFTFLISCNKSNSTIETFSVLDQNVVTKYSPSTIAAKSGVLVATVLPLFDPNYTAQLSCAFPDTTLPTANGAFAVVSGTPQANQVALTVSFNAGQTIYNAIGGNSSQTVAVSILSGKVTVVGTNIKIVNGNDTATVSLNITQQ